MACQGFVVGSNASTGTCGALNVLCGAVVLKFSHGFSSFFAMARCRPTRVGRVGGVVLLCLGMATAMVAPGIRAIITDVDGTLMPFATSSKLSERNRAALTAAKQAGCAVAVATGRIPGPWYDSLCSQLPGVLGPGVFSNGALVLGDEVFHASVLPAETVTTVVECLVEGRVCGRKIGALAVVAADGFEYSELAPEGPTWVTQLIQRAGEPVTPRGSWDPWLLQREVHKFVMFTVPDDPSWAAMDQLVPLLREKLAHTSATVLDCGAKQCEILPPGENKGTGVQRLLSVLGIDESEAMACGDAVNDVEMLKLVAKGVAMGDGTSIAQAAADVIVAAHTEDGVAEAIERYVL